MPRRRLRRRSLSKRRPLTVQRLEDRRLLTATPLGATVFDTGEFMLGTVGVVPIFFESDGSIDPQTQNWTPGEIDGMLDKIREGVHWWSETLDALGTVHTLDFVVDDTYAVNPVSTPYEPIDRISNDFQLYAGEFLQSQGYGGSATFEAAVHRFNHDQRLRMGTDWAFSIFVVDASDDPDGQFASGGSFSNAFAFPGGLFFVLPSSRPASTVAHEMGHIFWARDEYPGGGSWTDTRGYYNAQNLNAADNPTPGFVQQPSIMRGGFPLAEAYANRFSPASTLAMIGWQDSNGNGIFDMADVPLALDAVGYYDAEVYHFRGSAAAVPLMNQNSSGPQSDITLNRVSRLEYSLDGGAWITGATPDAQVAELDVAIPISEPFSSIRWRVIDDAIGVTSPIIEASAMEPAISAATITGYAFLDENVSGTRDALESLLAGTVITVRREDGSAIPAGGVAAAELGLGVIGGPIDGISLSGEGLMLDGRVRVATVSAAGDQNVFQAFDLQRQRWISGWSPKATLDAELDQLSGTVTVEFASLGSLGYGRVEAYDHAGHLIARATSQGLQGGEAGSVTVSDPGGQIARIRAFGHAGTEIAVTAIRYGMESTVVTDTGVWAFPNLQDGVYQIDIVPPKVIHQFDQASFVIDVVAGVSPTIVAAASRVTSPRHNAALPWDVNGDGFVTALDALLVINDLARNDARILAEGERTGPDIDVNNDGSVSALDALLVINELSRKSSPGSGEGEDPANQPLTDSTELPLQLATPFSPAGQSGNLADAPNDLVLAHWPAPEPLFWPAPESVLPVVGQIGEAELANDPAGAWRVPESKIPAMWTTASPDRSSVAEKPLPTPGFSRPSSAAIDSGIRGLFPENPELFLKPAL